MTLKTKAWSVCWLVGWVAAAAIAAGPAPENQPTDLAAATPPAVKVPTPPAAAPLPPATQPLRDPTQPDPALRQALEGAQGAVAPVLRPQITRRGLIVVAGKSPQALIDVQGIGAFIVHEHSVFSVGVNGTNMMLRVTHLSLDEMQITIDSQNVTITVR